MANGYDFNTPMLNLGGFIFCVNTAAYQHLRRVSEYRWATLERINHRPSLQWVGQGIEEYELQGVIYPTFRSSFRVLDGLRNLAQTGQPQQLTSGLGDDLGLWCVLAVDELHEQVSFKGAPLKQEFALRIRNFGPDQEAPGVKAIISSAPSPAQALGLPGVSLSELQNLPSGNSLIPPFPAVISAVDATQMLPYSDALSQAGMSPQQAAQAVTSSAKTFQQVLSTAQQIINAIAATKSTLQNVQSNFATDPAGTVAGLLNMTTADATVASGAMTTMFGSDLSGISNVTAALQQANMTIQGAQGGLSNDTLGTMARILTAGGGLPSSSLTTLFGSSTAGQMGLIGSAIQVTNMAQQIAVV